MMKKALALILAAISALSISVTAAAADATVEPEKYNNFTQTDIDVIVDADFEGMPDPTLYGSDAAEIEEEIIDITGEESKPVIYVEVEWDEMRFVYDFGKVVEYKWDLDELAYVPVYEYQHGNAPAWDKNSADIRFKNFSNRDVWTGVYFEKNAETTIFDDVDVTFDKNEDLLETAVGRGRDNLDVKTFTMFVEGEPAVKDNDEDMPALGSLVFYISEECRANPTTPTTEVETPEETGEHEHHFVYDQFGRLVCTGCKEVKHEYCIDMDEDGLCDECGMERDFCEDCHVGGKCICI